MKQIIENINLHKLKSADILKNQQITYIPTIHDDQIECTVQSYLIDGRRTRINQVNQVCFKLHYLNFRPMLPRKSVLYKNGIWSMQTLVDRKVIYPFMLFINGVFIPWETMDISIGQENYYITVDTSEEKFFDGHIFRDQIRDIKYAQIIQLPEYTRYERSIWPDQETMFSFNIFGEFSREAGDYAFKLADTGHHIMFNYWDTNDVVDAFAVIEDTSIKLTKENVMLFTNGKLTTGAIENIKKAHDGDYKVEETGRVNPCLEFVISDEELTKNPEIRFDSTLLTINSGKNENMDRYDIGVFVNYKYTETADNISKVSLDGLRPLIWAQNSGESNPEYLQDLQKPFKMSMDRTKLYDTNVANCIKNMLSYNASLFNSVYADKSNLVIEEYTGEWALSNLRDDGTIHIPRQHSEMIDEYILMLVNGTIYQYYYLCKYVANKYIVPIQNISYDDKIELLRFQNVNNGVTDLTVNEDDGFRNFSSEIINNDMILFSTIPDENNYDYPSDGLQHFPVEYTLEEDEIGYKKITLTNPIYYGQPLKVAYKNRYQHFWFNLTETTDKYTVDLGDKFMYCNDYSKYLVFYNGRRLGSDHYRLTLPVRSGTPFYKFDIYLTLPIQEGDRLDIIYVPSLMQDIVMIPEVPISGDIVLDKSAINHGLSTDLFMVWINGKKIPKSHISDIDSMHLRIRTNEESTQTVCVTKYIPDIDVLSKVFKDNEALWDKIMAQLSNEEVYTLLGIYGEDLENTEEDIYENAVDIKAIMYELIREQFMMNPRVDITGPFVYDYQDVDQTAIERYDSGDNAILPVADASNQENLDNVERPWP